MSITGRSPAELMFGRPLHSQFDLIHSNLTDKVSQRQENKNFVLIDMQ